MSDLISREELKKSILDGYANYEFRWDTDGRRRVSC